jgi:hypothetical protein
VWRISPVSPASKAQSARKHCVLSPNTFWTDLNQIDFSKETGKVLKLDLGIDQANVWQSCTFSPSCLMLRKAALLAAGL